MKKIISVLLAVVLCFASMGAYAANVPSFMKKIYNNYTADYEFSMEIHNADKIAKFINELGVEHIDKFIDVHSLAESLFDANSVINVQADFSADFRRINAAITAQTDQKIVFNRNYESSYTAKTGIWVKINIDKKEFVVVYSTPLNEKYAIIDISKDAPSEVADELFAVYDKTVNRESIEKHNKKFIELATEHADISIKGKKASLHYDNDAFTALVDDTLEYMKEFYEDASSQTVTFPQFPSLEGIKLLGDKGITCEFHLAGEDIKEIYEKWDISVGLADIFTKITGMPWNYEFDGNINITLKSKGSISKIGKTKVSMPTLTAENSFSLTDLFGDTYEYDAYIEEAMPYISSFVWGETETDTFDGTRYYMPLRQCIEAAYGDYSDITYDNGAVTISTNIGIEGRDISASFTVGEGTATVNGAVYDNLGEFRIIDGSVYASTDFYERCLGWSLDYLQKDLLSGWLYYEFYTERYDEYFE